MPKPTIAVVGASADRRKFGNKCVRAYASRGYEVYPIHPTATAIEGRTAYASVPDGPAADLARVSVCLPPEVGLRVLDELTRKPVRELWLNPGAESPALVERARQLGLNVVTACSIVDIGVSPGDLD